MGWVRTCCTSMCFGEQRQIFGTHWPACLAKRGSFWVSERPCLKGISQKTIEKDTPMSSSGLCMFIQEGTHTCTHRINTCVQHTHVCAHTLSLTHTPKRQLKRSVSCVYKGKSQNVVHNPAGSFFYSKILCPVNTSC